MPFLKKGELLPAKGGADFSIPSTYIGDGVSFPQNMQYIRGELQKRIGKSFYGDVSLGAQKILHLGIFELSNLGVRLVRHTKKNVQVFNTNTLTWVDWTGPDLTGGESDFFSSTVVNELDYYIFVNGVDAPRKMLDSQASQNLGGSPPIAKFCEYMTPYVLLANLTEGGNPHPYKVAWCHTGAPEVWTGGNSGSVLLSDEPSAIRQIKKLKSFAMVYKEKSIYRGYQSGPPSIFTFNPFSWAKGLYASRAIADDGQMHYYMGLQDFYKNDGIRPTPIGGRVREYVFNRLNRSLNNTCHAIHVEQYKEIWFFITIVGQSWPTEVWKYNYDLDFWYMDTVANAITANLYKQTSFIPWNQDFGTWASAIGPWDDQSGVSGAPFPVFGFDTGFVQKFDGGVIDDVGIAVDSHLDTKDYSGVIRQTQGGPAIERESRWLQLDLWARGDSVKCWYSTDYGNTWNFIGENQLTSNVEKTTFWFDVTSPHIRFRLQQDRLSKNLILRSLQPYFVDAGEIMQNF